MGTILSHALVGVVLATLFICPHDRYKPPLFFEPQDVTFFSVNLNSAHPCKIVPLPQVKRVCLIVVGDSVWTFPSGIILETKEDGRFAEDEEHICKSYSTIVDINKVGRMLFALNDKQGNGWARVTIIGR